MSKFFLDFEICSILSCAAAESLPFLLISVFCTVAFFKKMFFVPCMIAASVCVPIASVHDAVSILTLDFVFDLQMSFDLHLV